MFGIALGILVLLLFLGLAWLAAGACICMAFLAVPALMPKRRRPGRWRTVWAGVLMLLLAFISTIAFRIFIAEIYTVPSESMENTLRNGDNILVSKLNYGPKLPIYASDIPWIGLFYLLVGKVPPNEGGSPWPYRRLSGFSKLQDGDIIVFKMPDERGETLIKRCVGKPGDELRIRDGQVMANGHFLPPVPTLKQLYKLHISDLEQFSNVMEGLAIVYHFLGEDKTTAYAYTTAVDNDSLRRSNTIFSIEPVITPYENAPGVYPYDSSCKWTIDNYGPVLVPAKGMKIALNRSNYMLYGSLLDRYEKASIREVNGRFYTAQGEITGYTFKEDYCFVLGDNRDVSNDSRYWGFVPLRNIEGKAICILFSYAEGHFSWSRLLKGL